jgi:hypothetical protein
LVGGGSKAIDVKRRSNTGHQHDGAI